MDGFGSIAEMDSIDYTEALDSMLDIFSDDLDFSGADYAQIPAKSTVRKQEPSPLVLVREITNHKDPDQCSVEDEELLRAQEIYNKLTAEAREYDAKRMKLELTASIPKVMKNDIRRHYSRMFMNTINSADFANMQNYFNTFMSGPCKFIADHVTRADMMIPGRLVADGPRLMAHYLLGCFVMYPDMTLTLHDTRIVTSNSWAGTKIVMEMEIRSTKMYDLDLDAWIPQLATLDERYQAALKESALVKAAADKKSDELSETLAVAAEGADETRSGRRTPLVREVSAESTGLGIPCDDFDDGVIALKIPHVPIIDPASSSGQILHATEVSAPATTPPTPSKSKSKRGAKKGPAASNTTACSEAKKSPTNASKRKVDEANVSSSASIDSGDSVISIPRSESSYIPEAFVQSLFASAKLLPAPLPLHLRGEITMFLDENNHIQHMNLAMVQKNM